MPVEEILDKIENQKKVILNALVETDKLVKQLTEKDEEEYDWISVKKASQLIDVSPWTIYEKIKKKELSLKLVDTKRFVRRSEIVNINDVAKLKVVGKDL